MLPALGLLGLYGWSIREGAEGRGQEPAPTWVLILMTIFILVIGVSFGYICGKHV